MFHKVTLPTKPNTSLHSPGYELVLTHVDVSYLLSDSLTASLISLTGSRLP